MESKKIEFDYGNKFYGVMHASNVDTKMGSEKGQLAPYDMLYGALSSCLYATFLTIVNKKKLIFDSAKVIVTGEKRDTIPATLKWVNVSFIIKNADNEKQFIRSVELGTKYCSIYQTISKVATMSYDVAFEK